MTYFLATLVILVVATVLGMVFAFGALAAVLTGNAASSAGLGLVSLLAIAAVVLAYIYCGVIVSAKRLHDMGQPGWHVVWIFVTGFLGGMGSDDMTDTSSLIGALCLLVWLGGSIWLLFAPGESHDNDYGSVPV